jgi:hypothetical protein
LSIILQWEIEQALETEKKETVSRLEGQRGCYLEAGEQFWWQVSTVSDSAGRPDKQNP